MSERIPEDILAELIESFELAIAEARARVPADAMHLVKKTFTDEDAPPPRAVAKIVEQRDAAIARAEQAERDTASARRQAQADLIAIAERSRAVVASVRARDLADEDREALRWLRARINVCQCGECLGKQGLAVLDKLLGGGA